MPAALLLFLLFLKGKRINGKGKFHSFENLHSIIMTINNKGISIQRFLQVTFSFTQALTANKLF